MDSFNESLWTRRSFLKGSMASILGAVTTSGVASAEGNSATDAHLDRAAVSTPDDIHEIDRAVVLTDIHIGWSESNIETLLDPSVWDGIVKKNEAREIIFLGDVFDLWRCSNLKDTHCNRLLDKLETFASEDGKIAYVIGNHDYHLLKVLEDLDKNVPSSTHDEREQYLLNIVRKLKNELKVSFYHPFYQFKSDNRIFVATHGDNYDFLYWFEILRRRLKLTPEPSFIYDNFYEEVYRNPEIRKEFDQGDFAGAFFEWFITEHGLSWLQKLKQFFKKSGSHRHKASTKPPTKPLSPEEVKAKLAKLPIPLSADVQELTHLKDLDLRRVHNEKFSESLEWKKENDSKNEEKWEFYHPFDKTVDVKDLYVIPDTLLIGHYHDPRVLTHWNAGKLLTISDVGTCAEGKLSYGTITDGEYKLHYEKL